MRVFFPSHANVSRKGGGVIVEEFGMPAEVEFSKTMLIRRIDDLHLSEDEKAGLKAIISVTEYIVDQLSDTRYEAAGKLFGLSAENMVQIAILKSEDNIDNSKRPAGAPEEAPDTRRRVRADS